MTKIGVIGIPGGWSSERLADAVGRLTGLRRLIDLSQVHMDLDAGRVWTQDQDLTSYQALIVKKIGEDYSPQMMDRLDVLCYLAHQGVRLFSRPEKMAMVVNRLTCTRHLKENGLPIPPTVITSDPRTAAQAVEKFGPSVLKPLFTSKARGMIVVEPGPDLEDRIGAYQRESPAHHMIYIQKLLDLPGMDLGLVFLGGRYLITYARVGRSDTWNTTTANGGRYQAYQPSSDLIALADRAQRVFGLDFTCVDVAETAGGPVIFEVSAFGGFRGLEKAYGLDAADLYARHVLSELAK